MAYIRGHWAPTPYRLNASEHSLPPPSPTTGGGPRPPPPPPQYYSNFPGYAAPPIPYVFNSEGYTLPPPPYISHSFAYVPPRPAAPFFVGWNHAAAMRPVHPPNAPPQQRMETDVTSLLKKQIEYYFCDENLPTDCYLKKQMDDDGWVPVQTNAGFRMVKKLTDDVGLILESLRHSSTVEVDAAAGKMRRRGDIRMYR